MPADEVLLHSVLALMRAGHGEARLLERIKRALDQGEVVSVYERGYVEGLVEQHLKSKEPPVQEQKPPVRRPEFAVSQEAPRARKRPKKKLILIFAAIAVVVGGGAAGMLFGEGLSLPEPGTANEDALTVSVSRSSYAIGEIIPVSGSGSEGQVRIAILDSQNNVVLLEDSPVGPAGEYSTMVIAGGEGWKEAEQYKIIVSQEGSSATAKVATQ